MNSHTLHAVLCIRLPWCETPSLGHSAEQDVKWQCFGTVGCQLSPSKACS